MLSCFAQDRAIRLYVANRLAEWRNCRGPNAGGGVWLTHVRVVPIFTSLWCAGGFAAACLSNRERPCRGVLGAPAGALQPMAVM